MKKSEIVNKIHSLAIFYLLSAWIFPSQREYLVFLLPTLQFQFLMNNNECLLTQLETRFLKDEKKEDDKKDDDKKEDDKKDDDKKDDDKKDDEIQNDSFIDKKFKQLNINLKPEIREYIIHSSVYASFLMSYWLM